MLLSLSLFSSPSPGIGPVLFKYTPDATSHDGVATTDSSSHDGVATTDSSSHDGVATTDRYSNKCWRQQCSKYQPLTRRIPSRVGWYVVVRHLVEQEKVALMALALIQEVLPTLASFPAFLAYSMWEPGSEASQPQLSVV